MNLLELKNLIDKAVYCIRTPAETIEVKIGVSNDIYEIVDLRLYVSDRITCKPPLLIQAGVKTELK
ncbi:hypothetical protein ER57_08170 [Smithella sp. SCADC]|jgi:hypothetical protein|nr:hypothetical protein ER57_08170 [Smithella sp. SCADC]